MKPKNKILFIATALIAVLSLSRCTTDVDLTRSICVYTSGVGLLDAEVDTQWVKINRTWLGDGDQTQAALVQDSSEYDVDRIQARFVEVINGIDNRTFELVDTLLENKEDDGVFLLLSIQHTTLKLLAMIN